MSAHEHRYPSHSLRACSLSESSAFASLAISCSPYTKVSIHTLTMVILVIGGRTGAAVDMVAHAVSETVSPMGWGRGRILSLEDEASALLE